MVAVLGEQIGPKRYNHGRRKRAFLRSARRWRETFRPPRETERHSTGGLNAARHRELSQGLPQGFRPSQLAGRTPQGGPMHTVSRNAIPALTTEQMRAVDRAMVEDLHIELVQMMENAGRTLAELAITRFSPTSATVLAGPGGNGGGGLVAARHLANRGCQVQAVLSEPDRLTPVPTHRGGRHARRPGHRHPDPGPAQGWPARRAERRRTLPGRHLGAATGLPADGDSRPGVVPPVQPAPDRPI